MADSPELVQERSKLESFKSGMKKTLLAFIVVDTILVVGAVAVYLMFFRPQIAAVEARRDEAVRANVAMTVRIHAVEARLAQASGDPAGAARAAGAVQSELEGLLARIPKEQANELETVRTLVDRSKLVSYEIQQDPAAARADLEVIEAKLAALYPAVVAQPAK